ncbi:hypothetical protein PGTUg99_014552 [Puccinia graminis f. sp. tritici]|uniref:Anaphase-promoting complex subunit 11 n=1 Tax=Puccinia graminis f. sp. tritici TaxID=56615 RepID=A0A5B0MT20_PUCGR|nr:hypothetical protein PGTUg99_014552 [Puccinia graminis f. sp. tritici]
MKVTIKSFNPVAHWKWNLDNSKPIDPDHEPETLPALTNPDPADENSREAENLNAANDLAPNPMIDDEDDEDLCGICRVAFEGCCPDCKVPGDDCPLSLSALFSIPFVSLPSHFAFVRRLTRASMEHMLTSILPFNLIRCFFGAATMKITAVWGECTHIFHMHCLLKWIAQESSKQSCPMDRRPWVTAGGHAEGPTT